MATSLVLADAWRKRRRNPSPSIPQLAARYVIDSRTLQPNTPSKRADAVLDIMQACKAHGYEAEGLISLASARNSALQQFLKTLLGNDLVLLTPTRKLELTPEEYFGEK